MKRLKCFFFRALLLIFALSTESSAVFAQSSSEQKDSSVVNLTKDSIEISLLTCGPGEEVYSLYGHTAIRITNYSKGKDIVINYGTFSFSQKYFVLRFIFGLTDYEMGVMPFEYFDYEYRSQGRYVNEQVLNLKDDEKVAIITAVAENYRPENRIYRYNFFFDNCTTRARDMLLQNIKGSVEYANNEEVVTFRDLIHKYTTLEPLSRFGNDLLLGVEADRPISAREQQFIPFNLEKDFEKAVITNPDGSKRPLVKATNKLITIKEGGSSNTPLAYPFVLIKQYPVTIACIILAVMLIVTTMYERKHSKNFWHLDTAIYAITGICGLILFAMIFSQHPTVNLNFQILMLNPLNLILLCPVAKRLRKRQLHVWVKVYSLLLVVFIILGFWQCYADGMIILALSLLVRYKIKDYISIRKVKCFRVEKEKG